MIVSGGIWAPAYFASLFCITPIIILFGVRGGVVFSISILTAGFIFTRLEMMGIIQKENNPPAIFFIVLWGLYLAMQICFVWIPVQLMLKALISSQRQREELSEEMDKRQLAEENLKETKRLLEETQRISKLGGWEYDVITKRLTWTQEVFHIYGIDPKEGVIDVDNAVKYYAIKHQKVIKDAFRSFYLLII